MKSANDNKKGKNDVILKTQMYIISLGLLFCLLIPIGIKLPHHILSGSMVWHRKIYELGKINILPLVCTVMIILIIIMIVQLEYRWKGTKELPVRIVEVKGKNYEFLAFLNTYIIPLICMNMGTIRGIVVLFLLLLVIGSIFVKCDFYLGNPTLALLGYKLYTIQYENSGSDRKVFVITKDEIEKDDFIEFIRFDKNTWYVRRSSAR